jgi:RHS repeat-associated protein
MRCPVANSTAKERDSESGLDNFGARYYSNRFGRWLSADWSSVPAPVPYANLTNPQTLNLYAMVSDDPESFADLDGHDGITWNDIWNAGVAIFTGGSTVAGTATAVTIGAGGVIAGAEIEAFDLAITYPHEPCNCAVDAINPPYIEAPPLQNQNTSDSKPGTLGKPDHQQTVKEEAKAMGGQQEVTVKTPGGEKGSRRIDAAKVENDKVTEATQVIRPNKNGTPPAREVRAAIDIEKATGVKPKFVPVRPVTPAPKPKPERNQ